MPTRKLEADGYKIAGRPRTTGHVLRKRGERPRRQYSGIDGLKAKGSSFTGIKISSKRNFNTA